MLEIIYLISATCFIFGLKLMSRPKSAVRGNLLGALGMLLACGGTLAFVEVHHAVAICFAFAIGGAIGAALAQKIAMPSMPQLVALFNGFGGIASTLVATAEMVRGNAADSISFGSIAVSAVIGTVTFWGSLVAFAKLQELKAFQQPFRLPGQLVVNGLLALAAVVLMAAYTYGGMSWAYVLLIVLATLLGFTLTLPIGGADMPVVIALLNSYSGLAASATGFVIQNSVLIIAGSLVGASGIILTQIMCKAMNRSLSNVLFGGLDGGSGNTLSDEEVYATVRSTSADDVALILDSAQRVVIVPGYGMAVAQAQHAVRDLANLLQANGTDVEYGIHPVAGRMPGHMNVLLAEADVPYDQLIELERINPTFETVDVVIVIGANDVVNPLARTDPESPIAGMPILDVDKARTVVIIKRSLSPGFAKIPNPLFAAENALMLFGDGKQAVLDIVAAVKEGL